MLPLKDCDKEERCEGPAAEAMALLRSLYPEYPDTPLNTNVAPTGEEFVCFQADVVGSERRAVAECMSKVLAYAANKDTSLYGEKCVLFVRLPMQISSYQVTSVRGIDEYQGSGDHMRWALETKLSRARIRLIISDRPVLNIPKR